MYRFLPLELLFLNRDERRVKTHSMKPQLDRAEFELSVSVFEV